MARISGVDLPNKHVNIALTYVYGIGRSSANKICEETKVDPNVLINDLSEDDLTKLRKYIHLAKTLNIEAFYNLLSSHNDFLLTTTQQRNNFCLFYAEQK